MNIIFTSVMKAELKLLDVFIWMSGVRDLITWPVVWISSSVVLSRRGAGKIK
jgi:hypothetical protein